MKGTTRQYLGILVIYSLLLMNAHQLLGGCVPPCDDCEDCDIEDCECVWEGCPPCGRCRYCDNNCDCQWIGNCRYDHQCPDCHTCPTPECNCEYQCNPSNCETCVDGSCKVCGGDPNQVCCEGFCAERCKLVDGEDCSGSDESCVPSCAVGGTDCSWHGSAREFWGGTEEICSPRGCEGDCYDGGKNCYTDFPCIPASLPIPFTSCTDIGGGVHVCMPGGLACYLCVKDEGNPQTHVVQKDICSE